MIHKIAEIDDISFLKAFKTILDSKTDKEILTITAEQRNEILASKAEIEQGLYIDQDKLDKEVKAWLNAR